MLNIQKNITQTRSLSIVSELEKVSVSTCHCNEDAIAFNDTWLQKLYDSSPIFPNVKCILDNPNNSYIIKGGMRLVGARYPDYIINAKDIMFLHKIMEHYGIMKIPILDINKCIEKCVELVQLKLKTNLFNNVKTSKWEVFNMMTNSFRNLCMGIRNYDEYKGKFVPTNLSMLMFYTGDCREHSLLLLYIMRIYLHYNDPEKMYSVVPVYTEFGYNKNGRFVKEMEHTFPILVNKNTQSVIVIDALEHKTPVHQNPKVDIVSYKNISVNKIGGKMYYSSGSYNDHKMGQAFFVPMKWFKTIKCEYTTDDTFKNKTFLYGIPFETPRLKWVFDMTFNKTIVKNLYNSNLCKPKLNMKTIKKDVKKRNKTKRCI